jgi:hypothetical protein
MMTAGRRKPGGAVYFDYEPCKVCGSEVRLRAPGPGASNRREPDPDGTVDERVCQNPDCPTNNGSEGGPV